MYWYGYFTEIYRKKPHHSKSHYLMTLRSECVRMDAVNIRYPTNHLRARLGCEYARTMYRFYRRNANGTRLGRTFRWSGLRRLNHEQTIKALRSSLNDKVPF